MGHFVGPNVPLLIGSDLAIKRSKKKINGEELDLRTFTVELSIKNGGFKYIYGLRHQKLVFFMAPRN